MVAQKQRIIGHKVGSKAISSLKRMTMAKAKDIIEKNAKVDSALGQEIRKAAERAGKIGKAKRTVKRNTDIKARRKTAKGRKAVQKPKAARKHAVKTTKAKRASQAKKIAEKPIAKAMKFSERIREIATATKKWALKRYFGIDVIQRAKEKAKKARKPRKKKKATIVERVSAKAREFVRKNRKAAIISAIVAAAAVVAFVSGVVYKNYDNYVKNKATTEIISQGIGEENMATRYGIPMVPQIAPLEGVCDTTDTLKMLPREPEPKAIAPIEEPKEKVVVAPAKAAKHKIHTAKAIAKKPEAKQKVAEAPGVAPAPTVQQKQEISQPVIVSLPWNMAYDTLKHKLVIRVDKTLRGAEDNVELKFKKKPVEIKVVPMARKGKDGIEGVVDICQIKADDGKTTYYVDAFRSGVLCTKMANIVITESMRSETGPDSVNVIRFGIDKDGRFSGNGDELYRVSVGILPTSAKPQ